MYALYNGFVKLRRGIVEHLQSGQLNLNEFGCYCLLLLRAGYKTGIAYMTSEDFLLGDISLAAVHRALRGLEQKAYIKRFHTKGSKKPYPILLHKYEIEGCGVSETLRLNAVKSRSYENPVYEAVTEPSLNRQGAVYEPSGNRQGAVSDGTASPLESVASEPKEVRSKNKEIISEKEEDMKAAKQIPILCLTILGVKAERWPDVWDEVKELTEAFGNDVVTDAFESWAKGREGDAPARPVGEFLKVATGILRGTIPTAQNPELPALINDLVYSCQGAVSFGNDHKKTIGKWLRDGYTLAEIKNAFSLFFGQLDDFAIRRAAKDFSERGDQLMEMTRRVEADRKASEQLQHKLIRQQQSQVAKKQAEAEARAREEAELTEETLGS